MADQLPEKLLKLYKQLNITDTEFFEIFGQINWHDSNAEDSDAFLEEIQQIHKHHNCTKNLERVGELRICAICGGKTVERK